MKKIIIPKFDTKKMAEEISTEWDKKYNNNKYCVIVLSVDETLEQMGDKVQAQLKETIDSNLVFSMYLDEECVTHYYLGYSISEKRGSIKLGTYEGYGHRNDYSVSSKEIAELLKYLTSESLKICSEYASLIRDNFDTKPIGLLSGDGDTIHVDERENRVYIPVELSAYKEHKDIIKYFIRNSEKILKRREKAWYGRYFFKNMNVERSEVRKTISYIHYKDFNKEFKVC
jgi:hypothetical protein